MGEAPKCLVFRKHTPPDICVQAGRRVCVPRDWIRSHSPATMPARAVVGVHPEQLTREQGLRAALRAPVGHKAALMLFGASPIKTDAFWGFAH